MKSLFDRLLGRVSRTAPQALTVAGVGPVEMSHGDWIAMPAGLRDFMVVFESTNGMPPTPAQVALLMNFLSNKDQFFESAVRRLVSDGTTDNARGLEVYSVTVPSDPARAPGCFVLELCYPDAEQIFVVDFRDNQPTGSTYDD